MADRGAATQALELAGERLLLRGDRTLFWPRRRTLLLADPHFGKGEVFRRHGIALPAGATARDLDGLATAVAATGAERVVVLGDFFHAPPAADAPWLAELRAWRRRHAALSLEVVAGNHDRGAGAPDPRWRLQWHAAPLWEPPLCLCHEPDTALPGGPFLAGHLHPVVRLRGGGDRLRLPVFWQRDDGLVLPAFGSLTGGHPVRRGRGEALFAAGGDGVVQCAPGVSASG